MQQNEITIKIKSANPFDFKAKKEMLENISRCNGDEINHVGQIAKLQPEVINFLGELAANPKAIKKLMDNQNLIRHMVS